MKPYFETDLGKLYHGDCLEIMPELEPVDLVLTDPPYGVNYKGTSKSQSVQNRKTPPAFLAKKPIVGDDKDFNPKPFLNYNDVMFFGGNHFSNKLPVSNGWVVWDKLDGTNPSSFGDFDMIWHKKGTRNSLVRCLWRGICQYGEKGKRLHQNQKPLKVINYLIELTKANAILDPFIGSGTTAIACEKLNRRWIGIEISEEYCEIAALRIDRLQTQDTKEHPNVKRKGLRPYL